MNEKIRKVIGYIRVSTDKQTVENQRSELVHYAQDNKLLIDEFIEAEISSRKSLELRKLDELFKKLNKGDILLVSELSRLGRSTVEVLTIIKELIEVKQISVHIIKQGLKLDANNKNDMVSKTMITLFGLFAELERDLISNRTKEALKARKNAGVKLGKPKGTIQTSKYDKDYERIKELRELGLSINKIVSKHLKYGTAQSLGDYLKKIKKI